MKEVIKITSQIYQSSLAFIHIDHDWRLGNYISLKKELLLLGLGVYFRRGVLSIFRRSLSEVLLQ